MRWRRRSNNDGTCSEDKMSEPKSVQHLSNPDYSFKCRESPDFKRQQLNKNA
jgi:hypothetical protein